MALLKQMFIAALFGISSTYCETISTWSGGTGNWSTASDWTPATVPNTSGGNTYAVTIGSGGANAVTVDISPTVDSLTLGAVLRGVAPPSPLPSLTVLNDMTVSAHLERWISATSAAPRLEGLCRSVARSQMQG